MDIMTPLARRHLRPRSSELLVLALTPEELFNLPLLFYLPFNGILSVSAKNPLGPACSLCFGVGITLLAIRNRFHIHWELWTCRIVALLTLETILSLSWSIQPTVKLIYPAAIAVLVFFYANYLLERFSTQTFTRIMMIILAIQMFASLGLATLLPSLGVDNGGDDPNNAGAWQGIFAQKNMLGMSAALALAVTLGLRPRGASERIWRGLTFITTLIVAVRHG